MSISLGGFSFEVNANVGPAQQALAQLVQQAQQAGQQITTALGQPITPQVNAQQAVAGLQQVAAAQKQLIERPTVVTVRANLNEADQALDRLVAHAREIGNARLNLTINASEAKTAEAAIERMGAALRAARAGEQINLNIRATDVEHADAALQKLTHDIDAAKTAGARVAVNVQTNAGQGGFFQQAAGGFIQQVTPGLSSAPAVAAGVLLAQAIQKVTEATIAGIQAGVEYNAMLEESAVKFKVFLGSAEAADQALAALRKNADITPFNTDEVIRSGAVFAQVANGSIQRMQQMLDLAEQLAAVNPNPEQGGGLGGATIALREAQGGDFTSVERRFNVSRGDIQSIKDLGLSGVELAAALVKAAGGSKELVDALGDTFQGRLSTARSNLDNLAAAATKPIFDALSAGLAGFNAHVNEGIGFLTRYAEALGKVGAVNPLAFASPQGAAVAVGTALGAGLGGPATAPAQAPTEAEKQREQAAQAVNRVIDAQNLKINEQKKALEDTKDRLKEIELIAAKVTQAYEAQLRPLELQKQTLEANRRELQEQQQGLDRRKEAAGPSVDVRAEVAASDVLIQHDKELLDIHHQRAILVEQIASAEEKAAERVAERQIQAQERVLQGVQQQAEAQKAARQIVLEALEAEIRKRQEARQVALEALQEEIRKRQEARQAALEALRDEIQARQEARRAALDALREEIQGRQDARREALDGLREEIDTRRRAYDEERTARQDARQDAQDAFQEQSRLADRAHASVMQHYQDQIAALQAQLQVRHEQSAAERELAAFEQADSARQRAQTLAQAETAIGRARTGAARRDAVEQLAVIREQQAADIKREALQEKIRQEQAADEKRREAIQDKITALQQKAQDDDRRYQREKDARDEANRQQEHAQQLADRQEARAEAERRRQEDAQVRAAEKADRDQTKAENAQIKAQEKADQAQDRAEQAALKAAEASARAAERADQERLRQQQQADRAAERADQDRLRAQQQADRVADRAAQQQILAIQQQILTARNALSDRKEGFQDVIDAAALQRLREQAEIEKRILDNREKLAAATDPIKLADIASAQVKLSDQIKDADRALTLIDDRITTIKARQETELGGLKALANDLDIQIKTAEERIKALEAARDAFIGKLSKTSDLDVPSNHSVQNIPGTTDPAGPSGIAAGVAWVTGFLDTIKNLWSSPGAESVKQSFRQGGTDLGAAVDAGFAQQLTDDQTVKQAIDASTAAQQQQFKDRWGVQSPSTVMIELATQVAQGFIDGIEAKQQEMAEALETPIIAVTDRYFPAALPKFTVFGTDAAQAVGDGWVAYHLEQKILDDIERIILQIEARRTAFWMPGHDAGLQFEEGFCAGITGLRDCFARQMEWMIANANAYGTQVGVQFSAGFAATAGRGAAAGSGAGTGSGGGGRNPNDPANEVPAPGGQCPSGYRLWVDGQGHSKCVGTVGRQPGPPWHLASSGSVANTAFAAPTFESVVPLRAAGAILPASLGVGGSTAAARAPTVASLTQTNSGNMTLTVNQTVHGQPGQDPQQIAQMSVAMLIDAIDKAERAAPPLVRRTLPGAIGSRA